MKQFITKPGLVANCKLQVDFNIHDKNIWIGIVGNSDYYDLKTMVEFRNKLSQAIRELRNKNKKENK